MDHDCQRSAGNLINRAPKRRMSFASLKTNNLATLRKWMKKKRWRPEEIVYSEVSSFVFLVSNNKPSTK